MNSKVKELKAKMKGKSDEDIKSAVDELKEKYKDIKSQVKEYYEEKYALEMDELKKDRSYRR